MTEFLIRSLTDVRGFTIVQRHDGVLPRTATESYVPWAVTNIGQVVYARYGDHRTWRAGGDAPDIALRINGAIGGDHRSSLRKSPGARLRPYDSTVSQNRRRLVESELGLFALNLPMLSATAVKKVSDGIRNYHDTNYMSRRVLLTNTIYDLIGSYFYTNGRTGFGRISEANHKSMTPDAVRKGIMHALVHGTLDQKLSIHDAFGRKILPVLGGAQTTVYDHWGPILRKDWFDNKEKRGRVEVKGSVPTRIGGIVSSSLSGTVGQTQQLHGRGVDMFVRDIYRTPEPEANAYYDDLDTRNLLFGAGISGTTGTLLQAAFAFAGVLTGEMLKQYVLGIVGYLVGGGMHSYHESMAIAAKAGLPYTPGAYLPSLPASFTVTQQCRDWGAKYYDIVHLGATHWRYNAGGVPSHLNTSLGNRPKR